MLERRYKPNEANLDLRDIGVGGSTVFDLRATQGTLTHWVVRMLLCEDFTLAMHFGGAVPYPSSPI